MSLDPNTILLLVAGLVVPSLNSLIKQPAWTSRMNWLVSALTAAGLGGLVTWATDGITPEELVEAALAVFAVGQAVYHLIQKHTLWNAILERLAVLNPKAVDLEEGPVVPEDHA